MTMPHDISADDSPALSDLTISGAFAPAAAPRRVLVYAPLAYSTPHFETDLEIAQRHLDLGDTVELVLCDGELPSCQLNPEHETKRCLECVSRNLQGRAQLSAKVPVLSLTTCMTDEDHAGLARIPRGFADQKQLRHYRYENFDAGMATLSSLIDFVRSPEVDTRQYSQFIHASLYAAVLTFLALKRVLARAPYDRVYIYNGRWSMMRSAVRACESQGVDYYTHERGADFRKFALYRNVLPHDKLAFRARTQAAWDHAQGHPETRALAEAFFEDRRKRVEKTWFSFVKEQEQGRVPADWDRPGRKLVYFTSSEFEYAAIGDGTMDRIYRSQAQGAPCIARRLAKASPGSHLWIRVHPNDNTPETSEKWRKSTAGLANVTLIPPDAKIDSYALLDGAERVLTFGSTIGIEATYWGRPSVCADFSFYNGRDAQYEATTEDELIDLLTCAHLEPKPRENALGYGYYLNTYGGGFLHFETERISDYEFKSPFRGRCLKPDYDDLRRRLHELYTDGELHRAAAVARSCVAFVADDAMARSILVLSLLRLNLTRAAVETLEEAAAKTKPEQLAPVLKNTGKAFLDSLMALANQGQAALFVPLARRTGAVMQRVPAYAGVGQNLIGLADRARAA